MPPSMGMLTVTIPSHLTSEIPHNLAQDSQFKQLPNPVPTTLHRRKKSARPWRATFGPFPLKSLIWVLNTDGADKAMPDNQARKGRGKGTAFALSNIFWAPWHTGRDVEEGLLFAAGPEKASILRILCNLTSRLSLWGIKGEEYSQKLVLALKKKGGTIFPKFVGMDEDSCHSHEGFRSTFKLVK